MRSPPGSRHFSGPGSATGPGGDSVFLGWRQSRPRLRPGPEFEELEGGLDLARRATINAAVGPLIHAPATFRTALRQHAGPRSLDLPVASDQLGLRQAVLPAQEREESPHEYGLLLQAPLQLRHGFAQ